MKESFVLCDFSLTGLQGDDIPPLLRNDDIGLGHKRVGRMLSIQRLRRYEVRYFSLCRTTLISIVRGVRVAHEVSA